MKEGYLKRFFMLRRLYFFAAARADGVSVYVSTSAPAGDAGGLILLPLLQRSVFQIQECDV